jgi:multiple sugar transport system substrate-binding protein
MRSRLSWPVLAAVATLLLAACSQGTDTPSTTAQAPAATTSCASNGDLTMWERSGGNKQMVDMLVAAWNKKSPDCQIKLTSRTPRWSARSPRGSPPVRCPT